MADGYAYGFAHRKIFAPLEKPPFLRKLVGI